MTSSPAEPPDGGAALPDPQVLDVDSTGLIGQLQAFVDDHDLAWAKAVVGDLEAIDLAVYGAVAGVSTPTLDNALRKLTIAADNSKLWFGIAGATALLGGRRGRQAAIDGVIAIGLTSLLVNQPLKRLLPRHRPDRDHFEVIAGRQVPLPTSPSFPSGHSASAFAFANAMSGELTWVAFPVHFLAGAVAWSRIHTGVHFPGDVVVGALIGAGVGDVVGTVRRHRRERQLRTGALG
jgi:undecaprenyl-diphosphatase